MSNELEPWRESELTNWVKERRRNQFIGRCMCSFVTTMSWLVITIVIIVDNWPAVGAIIDGVAFTILAAVIAMAIIWGIPDWLD